MKNFSNHFLISMPHISDPIFSKSLIYLCENNSNGSLGLIINKPMVSENAVDILQKTGLEQIEPLPEVYFGGPVNIQMGLVLHESKYKTEGTLKVSNSIALTSNKKIVNDIKLGSGPNVYRFSMGYTGWEKGQLEKEIEAGDWLLIPAKEKYIFSTPDIDKWNVAATEYGIDVSNLGGTAGLA